MTNLIPILLLLLDGIKSVSVEFRGFFELGLVVQSLDAKTTSRANSFAQKQHVTRRQKNRSDWVKCNHLLPHPSH